MTGGVGKNYQVITTQMTYILENLTYKMVPVNPPPKKRSDGFCRVYIP